MVARAYQKGIVIDLRKSPKMKNQLLIIIGVLFFSVQNFAQKNNIQLTIRPDSTSSNILIFSVKNNTNDTISVDCFECPENKMKISNSKGVSLAYNFSYCFINNIDRFHHLKPNDVKSWSYDLNTFLYPASFYWHDKVVPKDKYKIDWIVNGVKAEPYYYDHR